MARVKSIIQFEGTFGHMTTVRSNTYGEHLRAPRGTHSPAEVNEAFKETSKELQKSNVPAKVIKDALDPYRRNFMGGMMWQRLVSLFRAQYKEHGNFDLSILKGFEIYTPHTLSRFSLFSVTRIEEACIQVNFYHDQHPVFKKARKANGYCIHAIAVFPDFVNKTSRSVSTASPMIDMEQACKPFTLELTIPPDAQQYLVCLKLEGYQDGVIMDGNTSKGMQIVAAGSL